MSEGYETFDAYRICKKLGLSIRSYAWRKQPSVFLGGGTTPHNKLHLRGSNDIFSAQIVNFGNGKQVMEEIGISESAIRYDYEPVMLSKLNSMLGNIKALPINEYIVMFDNVTKDILVTKPV